MRHTASLLVLLTCAAAVAGAQTININNQNRTLAVTATDSVSVFADVAVVHVGFQEYGADEQSAYAAGSHRSNAILAALNVTGVPKDQVESESQQISPLSEYELQHLPVALRNVRYRVTQSWTVHTHPDQAAKLLDVAVKAGANQSGNIDWEMADPAALEAQAAAKALAHAQTIASRMAEGLHTHIGSLLYASNQAPEEHAGPIRPLMMERAAAAPAPSPTPLAISNHKVERSATVYAVFQVE